MARITVEDCVEKTESRFELVMLAAQRARQIGTGAALLVERERDKNPVVALREIAEDKISIEELKEELIRSRQHILAMDDEEDVIDAAQEEEEWNQIASESAAAERAHDDIPDDDNSGGYDSALEELAGGLSEEEESVA